jgi:Zn-dependent M28 family amino/carboxypeptidase
MKRLLILTSVAALLLSCNQQQKENPSSTNTENSATINIPLFDADSAYRYVEEQLAFGPRVPGTKEHKQCAEYLITKMKQWTDTVYIQHFNTTLWDGSTTKGTNIISSIDPDNENRIVLAAHWDSRAYADHDADPNNHHKPILGANDGASGVAALMEMARAMKTEKPNIGIDIIFFDVEDQGIPEFADSYKDNTWCLGSQYWAANPHKLFYRAKYGILLDMVGSINPRYTKEEVSRMFAPGLTEKIWNTAKQLGYANTFINENTNAILDDHLYVNQIAKIPMVDIVQNQIGTSFFEHWHTTNDNINAIDKNSLKQVAHVVLTIIYSETK